jgi:hypothetical protein
MRVTALAVAAALTLAVATGCAGTRPQHQDGAAAPAGTPSASAGPVQETPPAESTPSQSASASATTNNTQTNTNTTPQRCRTSQLAAAIEEYVPAGKAGSTQDARVKLSNNGERCTLTGYVKLQLFTGSAPRETRMVESNGPPKTVTLDRGQSAWAQVAWSYLPTDDEQVEPYCSPRATSVAVTPPGQTESIRVTQAFRAVCNHGEIYASPVSATRPG